MRACIRVTVLLCSGSLLALSQSADLGVLKDGPGLAAAGANVTYNLTVSNSGPDNAVSVVLSDPLPAGMTFVSLQQNSGPAFVCSSPAVGTNGTVSCTLATFTSGSSATFSLTVKIDPAATGGTIFTNIATISSATPDPNSENDSGAAANGRGGTRRGRRRLESGSRGGAARRQCDVYHHRLQRWAERGG